ncbi:MAG: hypothetical protein PSU93_09420 [Methylobacter sp.]|uniref:Uncharacterized protein n=1 Tax=Candidatus Methylobacter titanis TaxID=3053457 RepID=A0AA43TQ04_9GAMM|nr:hypothetical protein [Candidatus Methylobacter titanis]
MSLTIDAMDRLDTVATCLEAIDDLLAPEKDLHAVNRDKFAVLMTFLISEQRAALDALSASVK